MTLLGQDVSCTRACGLHPKRLDSADIDTPIGSTPIDAAADAEAVVSICGTKCQTTGSAQY